MKRTERWLPWWLLRLIDRLCPSLCWASIVMWKLGYDPETWDWRGQTDCFTPGMSRCYCGKKAAGDGE